MKKYQANNRPHCLKISNNRRNFSMCQIQYQRSLVKSSLKSFNNPVYSRVHVFAKRHYYPE